MQEQSFSGRVEAGHKERAVEVPFNPAVQWGSRPLAFAKGRKGVAVSCRIAATSFVSQIVSRSGKHWLLLPQEVERAEGVAVGSVVEVSLAVKAAPPGSTSPPA